LNAVRRLVVGGALLLVFGLLLALRGEVALGLPGVVAGLASLVYYKLERDGGPPG
jgi:hypothetical protein